MEIRRLFKDEVPPYELMLIADPSIEIVKNYIKTGETYVLEKENTIIGVYILLETRSRTVEIVNLAVIEEERGKGLGKHLLEDAIRKAKTKGYRTIEIGTGNSSVNQLALYQKCGFRIMGVDFDYFLKNYSNEIFENGIQCRDMIRLAQELS